MPSAVSPPAACLRFPAALASRSAERLRAVTASPTLLFSRQGRDHHRQHHQKPPTTSPQARQQQICTRASEPPALIRIPDHAAPSPARLCHSIRSLRTGTSNSPEQYHPTPHPAFPTFLAFIIRKRTAASPFLIEPRLALQLRPFLIHGTIN